MPAIMKTDTREWVKHPLRTLRELMSRRDPSRALVAPHAEREWMTQFEVRETNDGYVFHADVPGASKADLEVTVRGQQLMISGTRPPPPTIGDGTYLTQERGYGHFMRTFTLPANAAASDVKSSLAAGVLTLVIPKRTKTRARTIPISAGQRR